MPSHEEGEVSKERKRRGGVEVELQDSPPYSPTLSLIFEKDTQNSPSP